MIGFEQIKHAKHPKPRCGLSQNMAARYSAPAQSEIISLHQLQWNLRPLSAGFKCFRLGNMWRRILKILFPLAALWGLTVLFLQRIWFYRDPIRISPNDPELVISPCDGQVVYIRRIEDGTIYSEKLGERIDINEITKADWPNGDVEGEGWIIGIYMSPLDVHFNYAPIVADVKGIVHTQTSLNLPMVDLWEYIQLTYLRKVVDLFAKRYELENERQTVFLENAKLRIAMVEIADKFVNKISTYVAEGDRVRAGQKISFIERGSQVDLVIFGDSIDFLVEVGQQVYGGLTPIGRVKT